MRKFEEVRRWRSTIGIHFPEVIKEYSDMKTKQLYKRIRTEFSDAQFSVSSSCLRGFFAVLFLISAGAANVVSQTRTYFYVSDMITGYVLVYDQNFVYQHAIPAFVPDGDVVEPSHVSGMDFMQNGNLVVAGKGWGRIKIYDPSGAVVSDFTHAAVGFPLEVKAGPSDLLYVATDGAGISEFSLSGTFLRSFPTSGDGAVAVLPQNVLWAGGLRLPGAIDVFDITTGARTSTLTLDNGQSSVTSMSYSAATGTVLMCDGSQFRLYERTLSGAFLRTYDNGLCSYGVIRAPNGNVYSTVASADGYSWLDSWTAGGTYTGAVIDLGFPFNIVSAPYAIPGPVLPPVNHPPVLANVPSAVTISELTPYSFTATATDPDGDNLRFQFGCSLSGAAIDPVTGVFTWTPTESQGPLNTNCSVLVIDDDPTSPLYDTKTITLIVNEVNSAPVLNAISNQTAYARTSMSFTATASDFDIPTNTLRFSLAGAPSGAAINAISGVFAWTPTTSQTGQYTFTVRVSDNGTPALTDEQLVTVTVSHGRSR